MSNGYKTYYRRSLPHYQPPGYTFFITFRLAGSLPKIVVEQLKCDYEKGLKFFAGLKNDKVKYERYRESQEKYFEQFDSFLDKSKSGKFWLRDERIASMVKDSIHYRDGKEYSLIAYCIMPNHVHLVFTPIVERFAESLKGTEQDKIHGIERNSVSPYIVTKILQDLKKYTARESNVLLNRKGQFWQHESYDHVVRDEDDLRRIVEYVLNNPVKASLIDKPEDWKWSYVNTKLM
jgi:putative transposase